MGCCFSNSPEIDFDEDVNFNHFSVLRAIGKGAYGKVCIVKKKDTKVMYAMKYMKKARIIRKAAVDNVLREQEMLKKIDHPFIVKLWFTFQDEEDLFMVVDLLLGGDLGYHLQKYGRMSLERVKLYVAELALALDYLKTQSIIHRDVKPANLLLHSNGHVYLSDFNVACYVTMGHPITSITGTRPYIAPEIFSPPRGGYSYSVDWWSLGVSVYELLRGQRPFHINDTQSAAEMTDLLCSRRSLSMSSRWDNDTCDLIRGLLHPDPSKRISSVKALKQLTLYSGENWDAISAQDIKPVFVPPKDQVFCDPTHELEEMIIEPNPLHKKSRRLSDRRRQSDSANVNSELDISPYFMIYDRTKQSSVNHAVSSPLLPAQENSDSAVVNHSDSKVPVSNSNIHLEPNSCNSL